MIIGFVLTSIVGGFVGSWFQYRLWTNQEQARVIENKKEQATIIYKESSAIMSKIAFRFQNYNDAYLDKAGKEHMKRLWLQYEQSRDEWISNYNRNRELISMYFGKDKSTLYENFERTLNFAEMELFKKEGDQKKIDASLRRAWGIVEDFNKACVYKLSNYK